jgi:acyl CoA:acetate/3-ketoacid CoA transferase
LEPVVAGSSPAPEQRNEVAYNATSHDVTLVRGTAADDVGNSDLEHIGVDAASSVAVGL